jgi:hypothetical protein
VGKAQQQTVSRIRLWQNHSLAKRRFVVVDCTGFEAIIAREVGKRRRRWRK